MFDQPTAGKIAFNREFHVLHLSFAGPACWRQAVSSARRLKANPLLQGRHLRRYCRVFRRCPLSVNCGCRRHLDCHKSRPLPLGEKFAALDFPTVHDGESTYYVDKYIVEYRSRWQSSPGSPTAAQTVGCEEPSYKGQARDTGEGVFVSVYSRYCSNVDLLTC